ncbi:MAG: hypothetical protein ACREQ4_00990 [Candidatus Binataceae bacterium]
MARKLLHTHMEAKLDHEIDTIVENLKSNLFFHGHLINRKEAKEDLNLKVTMPPADLELAMWQLYLEYSSAINLTEPFSALHELDKATSKPGVGGATTSRIRLDKIPCIYVESACRADVFLIDLGLQKASINTPMGAQEVIKQEVIWQRWEQEP